MDHGGLNGRPQKLEDVSELRSYVKVDSQSRNVGGLSLGARRWENPPSPKPPLFRGWRLATLLSYWLHFLSAVLLVVCFF